MKEEVLGRKDVKVDKNLRGSWKYSGEHRDGSQAGPKTDVSDAQQSPKFK